MLQTDAALDFTWGDRLPAVLQQTLRPAALAPRPFTVRLFFAEPAPLEPGARGFSVRVGGKEVLAHFDVVRAAGGVNRGVRREFQHVPIGEALAIEFQRESPHPPLLCGVELIAE